MPTSFRPCLPSQALLLPADLREWVQEDHLARQVSDLVDSLDLSTFYAPCEGVDRRNAPYGPSMMVKVLIYAYATGTFSSWRVARKLEEDVAFRMLAAGNFLQRPPSARSEPPEMPSHSLSNWTCFSGRVTPSGQGGGKTFHALRTTRLRGEGSKSRRSGAQG